jgi:hypothetical protein
LYFGNSLTLYGYRCTRTQQARTDPMKHFVCLILGRQHLFQQRSLGPCPADCGVEAWVGSHPRSAQAATCPWSVSLPCPPGEKPPRGRSELGLFQTRGPLCRPCVALCPLLIDSAVLHLWSLPAGSLPASRLLQHRWCQAYSAGPEARKTSRRCFAGLSHRFHPFPRFPPFSLTSRHSFLCCS